MQIHMAFLLLPSRSSRWVANMLRTAQTRASTSAWRAPRPRRLIKDPTEAEVAREIGIVLAAMLALAFAVNLALTALGIE
jgi:hypothetical protein